MKTHPLVDREFVNVSPFLKRALNRFETACRGRTCLDIPAGNGRNTFLLASVFTAVTAVDINQQYLDAIVHNRDQYMVNGTIQTVYADILSDNLPVDLYDFICNIHLFDTELVKHSLEHMKKGALLLVETPGCQGENYKLLPTQHDASKLFMGCSILIEEFKICAHKDNVDKRGVLKILVRK